MTAHAVRTIAVGVDGSTNARDALDWAISLGTGLNASVIAVHARGLLEHLGPPAEEVEAHFRGEWTAPLDALGSRGHRRIEDGDPVTVLRHVADEANVDLIVVGTRGLGDHPGLVLGSTSHQMAEDSRCPVLIVPPREA
jgi:nucleotide-binding universal stress UspA family protein